jgi:hypothetical protein
LRGGVKRKNMDKKNYNKSHGWLKKKYGKASYCENKSCKHTSSNFQWALKHGKEYECKKSNFLQLCSKCHAQYDIGYKKTNYWNERIIRVNKEDSQLISKLSKKEGRTIKGMFREVVNYYLEENQSEMKYDQTRLQKQSN